MAVRTRTVFSAFAGDEPPTEFRLLGAGVTETSKGRLLYDDAARAAVFAEYERAGVDLIIDLEHDSLDEQKRALRADAGDARGWFKLEDRGGELWAVNVRWTPDGERRLREKTQRYTSPALLLEEADENGLERVVSVLNVALCAMPATYHAAPLVAASKDAATINNRNARAPSVAARAPKPPRTYRMDPEKLKAAIAAIKAQDAEAALALLEEMVVGAAAGGEAPAEEMSAPEGEALAEVPDAPPEDDKAMMTALRTALGAKSNAEAVSLLSATIAEVKKLSGARESLEAVERRGLIAKLVELEAETPATAWEDSEKLIPSVRLRRESLDDMRARVTALSAARGNRPAIKPATRSANGDEVAAAIAKLTPKELSAIEKRGMTPAQFIAHRDSLVRTKDFSR